MAVAVIAAYSAQAQQSIELSALQQQLSELSAKIAQLEKANAEKTALVAQTAQVENANAAKIAQIEQENAKKSWSIEQLQANAKDNPIPEWTKNTKISGDFRYRYENIESDSLNTSDRQRVRLRVGITGKVNENVDYGVRLATGGASATSANENIGGNPNVAVDGTTKKEIRLDQYYVNMHHDSWKGANLYLGKMPQPWIGRTGLIWDGDLNPEGAALTYVKDFQNVKLSANGGSFVITERKGDDVELWAGQLVADTKIGETKVQLGVSDFYFDKVDTIALGGNNTPNSDFHLLEGFGSVGFKVGNLPVSLNGQYVVNTEAATDQDTAYLLGFSVGKAKDKGTWEAGYNWRDVQRDAVLDAFNDSDFANGTTGHHGHSFWAKYQIAKNLQAGATYMLAVNNAGDDINTVQLDLNFKF
jgi:hypothetical protein